MTDPIEQRVKGIASELQGMRGNQRDMLTDLEMIRTRIPEIQTSQKRIIWLLGCVLFLLVIMLIRG
jgi:hypothetical protein